jgi:hypothetical protein
LKKACECGCGGDITDIKWGYVKRFIHGHNRRGLFHPNSRQPMIGAKGKEHHNWKGGTTRENGYIFVRCERHPRGHRHGHYIGQHILVMERYLGRYLYDNEVVHHINGIRDDNRIENLQLMTRGEHTTLHHQLGSYPCGQKLL